MTQGGAVMKVVLFCGGYGMRLREYSESIPKPMVPIGYRPILWHVMKYYAHFGHKDFILCLGWKANVIKEYFLKYDECVSNDFVLESGGNSVRLLNSDIQDWNITFVDTGVSSNIGQRLMRIQPLLSGEKTFLANYTDNLCDLNLSSLIHFHHQQDAIATFASVRPTQSFHAVSTDDNGRVHSMTPIGDAGVWMNGGYFVLEQKVFDWIHEGEELVAEPFQRLASAGRLCTHKHDGFWSCMDTYKEKQAMDDRITKGDTPWEIWSASSGSVGRAALPTLRDNPFKAPTLSLPVAGG